MILAITLTQPWASLVALGLKAVETRSWRPSYRGPLAIHAAAGFACGRPAALDALTSAMRFPRVRQAFEAAGIHFFEDLPLGAVVATCVLGPCRPTSVNGYEMAWISMLSEQERAFGNYEQGRFGWFLEDVERLDPPAPAKGAQGLWKWNAGPEILTAGVLALEPAGQQQAAGTA